MSVLATQVRQHLVIADPVGAAGLGTVLGVWAHPDDEAYLSAGLMAMVRAAGHRVVCVTATRGEHGTDDPERFPPADLARLRTGEMAASMAALDVREHRFLGLEDGTLADIPGAPQVDRIRRLIAWFRPDTIVTFGPDGMTGHPDHRAVSGWTTAAWRHSGCIGRLMYATTTDTFADEHVDLHRRLPVFGPGLPMRTPEHELALSVAVRGVFLDTKHAALSAHASQTRIVQETFGEAAFREWWRNETFVDASVTAA